MYLPGVHISIILNCFVGVFGLQPMTFCLKSIEKPCLVGFRMLSVIVYRGSI